VHAESHDATEKEEIIREILHSMTNWEKDKPPVGYVYPGHNFPSHPMGNTSPAAFSSVSASQQLGEEDNTYATLKLFILQHAVTPKRRVNQRSFCSGHGAQCPSTHFCQQGLSLPWPAPRQKSDQRKGLQSRRVPPAPK